MSVTSSTNFRPRLSNNQLKLHRIGTHKRKEELLSLILKLIKEQELRKRKVDAVDLSHISNFHI